MHPVATVVPQVAGNVIAVHQIFGGQGDLKLRAAEVVEADRVVTNHCRVRINFLGDDDGVAGINQLLVRESIAVLGFVEEIRDLEAVFMGVTKGIVT